MAIAQFANDRLFISLSSDGKNYGLRYERMATVLVNAVQELSAEVNALKAAYVRCYNDNK